MTWKDDHHAAEQPLSSIREGKDDPPLEIPKQPTDPTPQSTYLYRERIRAFLAIGIVCLLVLLLIIYAITREVVLLGTGTIFVTIGGITYHYYFPGNNRQ